MATKTKHGDEPQDGEPESDIVVSDNGTGFVKCGYALENFPRHTFPSLVGRPMLRAEESEIGDTLLKAVMVGDEASRVRKYLDVHYPIENGIVQNWTDMEHLWDHTFKDKLGFQDGKCGDHRILLTEAPLNPEANKKKFMEYMFEKYEFDSMQVQTQAMLTLYAQGLMTGVVLDSGDGVTHVVCVYEGFVPAHLTQRLNLAGRHVTRYLIRLLQLRGYSFNSTSDFETVRTIKEELCYTALDYKAESKLAEDTTALVKKFTLPDGKIIKIGRERFQASEAMFNPNMADVHGDGVSNMIYNAIMKAEYDLRLSFFKHVVLSGGSTMYPGLPTRIDKDIKERYLKEVLKGDKKRLHKFRLNVEDPPRRKNMVFLGASVLGGIMKDSPEFWLDKEEYQELGADAAIKRLGSAP